MLLLATAGALAGCQSLPRSVTIEAGQPTTLTWIPHNGPELSLRNASCGHAADVYSTGADPGCKVVPDHKLQKLLDVFTAEELFALSLPVPPGNARDVMRLDQSGTTWFWARRGSYTDPREQAFLKVQNYFLALYNDSTAYHSAPDALRGSHPKFLSEEALARREAELWRYYEQKRRRQAARGRR